MDIGRQNFIKDDFKTMQLLGIVVDNNDPLKKARCRIRIFGRFDEIADEDLPWASPTMNLSFGSNTGSGSMSFPKKGTVVAVSFNNGNIYAPEYFSIQEMSDELQQEVSSSYTNFNSIIYDSDEDLKMFYTQEKGITISLKDSKINISNDNSITIEHRGTSSIIELRGNNITVTSDSEINQTAGTRIKDTSPEVWVDGKETKLGHVPAYSAVLAEPLFAGLKALAAIIDSKMYPTPATATSLVEQLEQLATSSTVKVSK